MSKGTTRHTVRVDDELWTAALTKAKEQGDNLSDILRNALREYLKTPADNNETDQRKGPNE